MWRGWLFLKGHEKTKQKSDWLDIMTQLLKGSALAGAIAVIILFVGAIAISNGLLQVGITQGLVCAACMIGSFSGALFAVQKGAPRAILLGFGMGTVLFLLLTTAGLLVYGATAFSHERIAVPLACCCGGVFAGFLRRKPKKKRKR